MPAKAMISSTAPSIKRPIYAEQANLFARLLLELISAWERDDDREFCDLPEYGRVIQGAYACGFVCRDVKAPEFMEQMGWLTQNPAELRAADFTTIRQYVHTIMRMERLHDSGDELGGGFIYDALRRGALAIVADRLRHESAWRGT